jgi:3-dehydroquinate synthase
MKETRLNTTDSSCRILVGESFKNVGDYLPGKKLVIITDEHVSQHYGAFLPDGLLITIKPGESSKTLGIASEIYGQLIANEIDRQSFILGVGGGIVCDLAGYIASTYLRGISFGFVSSTLLSQVDASIGGKNGVNYEGYKNMVGVVRQPEFVICDPDMLATLPLEEYYMGFAEVIKYGAILNAALFDLLEKDYMKALDGDGEILEEIISICVKEKCRIVEADEKESGERKKLNFGHTFAHAFEKNSGIPHGSAVSIGMVLAAGISEKLGLISQQDVDRLQNLLVKYHLPVKYPHSFDDVFEVMKRDKKRDGGSIGLILLDRIGEAVIRNIELATLKNWIDDLHTPRRHGI